MFIVCRFFIKEESSSSQARSSPPRHTKKKPMNVVYTDVFVQIQEEKEKIDLLWQETGWTARLDVSHHVGL